ncbi:MAG: hypothetical protein ABI633_04300 [Burkholderiales bacterium]
MQLHGALKVEQPTKNATGFAVDKSLCTQTFAVAMNKAACYKLPPDLKASWQCAANRACAIWYKEVANKRLDGEKPAADALVGKYAKK